MNSSALKHHPQTEINYRARSVWGLLNDIMNVPNSIKRRAGIRDKAYRYYKKFIGLEDADRFFLINYLSESNSDTSRVFLEKALTSDRSKVVRHEAAFSLGCVGDSKSCEFLRNAIINDDSILVKHEAIMALAEIGSKEDLSFLKYNVWDDNEEIIHSCQIAKKRLADRLQHILPPSDF